jgi:hypothetical protein
MKGLLIVLCGFVGSLLLTGGLQASALYNLIDKIKKNDSGITEVLLFPTGCHSNVATKVLCDALTKNEYVKSVVISQALDVYDPKVYIFDDDHLLGDNPKEDGKFTPEFYYLDGARLRGWIDCLKKNKTINKLIIDDATFHEAHSPKRFEFFQAVAMSKHVKIVGFSHCEIQMEDFILLLGSQSIQELSLRRNPELFSLEGGTVRLENCWPSMQGNVLLNPSKNTLTQSLKILDLRGTEFDDECRKGVLMNASFRKKIYAPFRTILRSIGSLERVIVSKVYCDDGNAQKAMIPFKTSSGSQNTNQNLNNQMSATNSSNGGSKTSEKSKNKSQTTTTKSMNGDININKNEKISMILNGNLNINWNNTNYLNVNTINLKNGNKCADDNNSSSSENSSEFIVDGMKWVTDEPLKNLKESQILSNQAKTEKAEAKNKKGPFNFIREMRKLTPEQLKNLNESGNLLGKEMAKEAEEKMKKAKAKMKEKIEEEQESEDSSDDDGNKDNK